MVKTVVGLFDTAGEAEQVVRALVDSGFNRNEISVIANNVRGEHSRAHEVGSGTSRGDAVAEGASAGAVGGTVLGGAVGLLVGVGLLTIPGIGPVLAAGPLAAALGSTALGAGIGSWIASALGLGTILYWVIGILLAMVFIAIYIGATNKGGAARR